MPLRHKLGYFSKEEVFGCLGRLVGFKQNAFDMVWENAALIDREKNHGDYSFRLKWHPKTKC